MDGGVSGKDGQDRGPPGSADVARIELLLRDAGVFEFEPRVVGQLLEFAYSTTRRVLTTAKELSGHCGKTLIDENDVQLALEYTRILVNESAEREKTLRLAEERNKQPLPVIRHNYGLKLPNDRFCLLQPNIEWRPEGAEQVMQQASYFIVQPPMHHAQAQQPMMNMPVRQELRPEHVANLLKRPAPDDYD